jgi:hypothetical protein
MTTLRKLPTTAPSTRAAVVKTVSMLSAPAEKDACRSGPEPAGLI